MSEKSLWNPICLVVFFALLTSCGPLGLQIDHFPLSKKHLPSSFARSPDPQQDKDFQGEMILVYYQIKEQELQKDPVIHLELLFKDLSTKTLLLPIKKTKGVEKIEFLNEEFSKHGRMVGYRATLCQYEIKSPLWAKVIEIDGKKIQP
jgi:hypothetical protein